MAGGHVIDVRVCFDSHISQLTSLINTVVSEMTGSDLYMFSSVDRNLSDSEPPEIDSSGKIDKERERKKKMEKQQGAAVSFVMF